jgi:hypothetical protein
VAEAEPQVVLAEAEPQVVLAVPGREVVPAVPEREREVVLPEREPQVVVAALATLKSEAGTVRRFEESGKSTGQLGGTAQARSEARPCCSLRL